MPRGVQRVTVALYPGKRTRARWDSRRLLARTSFKIHPEHVSSFIPFTGPELPAWARNGGQCGVSGGLNPEGRSVARDNKCHQINGRSA
ncbi:hypothetical protein FA13DRAFT_1730203 [Coprinellus micaceus]|uniref:Uncharacterized protein n=1 Tax=Coprinellus micaceus TaxID=71717 RepID=A0A4Y7TIV7_COPMI|nr:hypothetical protein FA13DRAFT_1730203 [Coprinellus micaceus]